MVNKTLVNELINALGKVLPVNQFTDEVRQNIKESITAALHEMDIVTREEFEAQQQVLQKTRQKIEHLENKLMDYNMQD